jgi:hypothetical protein
MAFFLKQNDTSPSIRAKLVDGSGVTVNLAGCAIRFHMRPGFGGAIKVDAPASVIDSATGVVQYNWAPADTDVVGQFIGEFEVTFPGGIIETFPNYTNLQITISPEIA